MFREIPIKGIDRYLIDAQLEGEPLHLHLSEASPGSSLHPPHRHGGYEAFYILDGEGTLQLDEERVVLRAGEAAVFDPQQLHGLTNTGSTTLRYLVVLRP